MLRLLRHGPFAFWTATLLLGCLALVVLGASGVNQGGTSVETPQAVVAWELLDAYGAVVGTEGPALSEGLQELARVADRCDDDSRCVEIARSARELAREVTSGASHQETFEKRLRIGRLINTYTTQTHPGGTP